MDIAPNTSLPCRYIQKHSFSWEMYPSSLFCSMPCIWDNIMLPLLPLRQPVQISFHKILRSAIISVLVYQQTYTSLYIKENRSIFLDLHILCAAAQTPAAMPRTVVLTQPPPFSKSWLNIHKALL